MTIQEMFERRVEILRKIEEINQGTDNRRNDAYRADLCTEDDVIATQIIAAEARTLEEAKLQIAS